MAGGSGKVSVEKGVGEVDERGHRTPEEVGRAGGRGRVQTGAVAGDMLHLVLEAGGTGRGPAGAGGMGPRTVEAGAAQQASCGRNGGRDPHFSVGE